MSELEEGVQAASAAEASAREAADRLQAEVEEFEGELRAPMQEAEQQLAQLDMDRIRKLM